MNPAEIAQSFGTAHQIAYTRLSDTEIVLDSPVPGRRNQQVLIESVTNTLYNRKMVRVSSVVCPVSGQEDLSMLLEQSAYFNYCRFAIRNNKIVVEAVTRADEAVSGLVDEIIMEVANLADQYELKLTRRDLH